MAEMLRANILYQIEWAILLQRCRLTQVLGGRGRPTNHSFSQKTSVNDPLYGIKISTDFSCFVTIHTFDRQTEFSLLDRACFPCSAVKIVFSNAGLPNSVK